MTGINPASEKCSQAGTLPPLGAARKTGLHSTRPLDVEFSQVLDFLGQGIGVIGRDYTVKHVNPAFTELTGVAADQAVGRKCWDVFGGPFCHTRDCRLRRILAGKTLLQVEAVRPGPEGQEVPCIISAIPLLAADGSIQGMLEIFKDIRRRKRLETQVVESEGRYRALVELGDEVGEAIVMMQDTDSIEALQTFASERWSRITGYGSQELLTMSFFDLVSPRDRETSRERYHRKMAGEVMPGLFELTIRGKDGREVPVELTSAVTSYGNKKANVAYIRDVSERKRVEEQLRKSEERFRSTMDEMGEPCLIISFDYRVVYANRASAEYAHLEPDEMRGRPIKEIFSESDNAAWFETMRKCMEQRLSDRTEYPYTHPRHGKVWLAQHTQPIPEGLFLISQDITGRKQSEITIRRSREQLRRLSMHLETAREKERQTVAAEIHDELGQLLTALKMDAVMLGNKLPADQMELIARAKSMRELVDITIQAVKRISAELRPHVLDNLGLAAAIEWQVKQVAESSGISCRFVAKPPELMIENGVSSALFRICQEALTNAVRHSGARRINVNLTRYAHRVRLVVKDDGRGIGGAEMEDQKSFGIIGMRERVRNLGGVLKITGVRGKGTTVSASIPLRRKEARR